MSNDNSSIKPAYVVRVVVDVLTDSTEQAADVAGLYKEVSNFIAASGKRLTFRAERYDGVKIEGPVAEQVLNSQQAAAEVDKKVDKNAN